MNLGKKRFILIALSLSITLALSAPFIASSNPDGLESAAENFDEAEGKAVDETASPFPDYIIPALGDGSTSSAVALILGIGLIFGIAYGVSKIVRMM